MKYIDSPFGFVLGKWADVVGGKWKGIYWIRKRVFPTQRGTLAMYYQLKAGLIPPERFSYKQFNLRRVVLQVLGFVGRLNLGTYIYPIWEFYCSQKKLKRTGINQFVAESARRLFESMPDTSDEYDPATNCPDYKKLRVSDGDLEAVDFIAGGTAFEYNPVTGDCIFRWKTGIEKNGASDDYVYCLVFEKPVVNTDWEPTAYLWGRCDIVPIPKRGDGNATVGIGIGRTKSNLIGFIFARDKLFEIGFSRSVDGRIAT